MGSFHGTSNNEERCHLNCGSLLTAKWFDTPTSLGSQAKPRDPWNEQTFTCQDQRTYMNIMCGAGYPCYMAHPERLDAPQLWDIIDAITRADPDGSRASRVFRDTFDQLYDGEHTGRYAVDQLYKTEKTHFGTLIEINLRREFRDVITDGDKLDYQIAGHDIDCKFSFTDGGWMLPPECFGLLLLVATADDGSARWSLGVVRANDENRNTGSNRDAKVTLNTTGRSAIYWLHRNAEMAENILLTMDETTRDAIMGLESGQARVNELFRRAIGRRISRAVIATVAQQKDYMKRVRYDGGARSHLRPEGYLILGDYASHSKVAESLGAEIPGHGEFVSVRVVPCDQDAPSSVLLGGRWWRQARADEEVTVPAPLLPTTKRT